MNWEERWGRGETGWDHGAPSPPLREYVETHAMQGRAIVPGCGSGHEVRLLAAKGLEVTGVDLAATAVERASAFPAVNGEQYRQGDWMRLPVTFGARFDWVLEHAFLCALPPARRVDYTDAVDFALSPGGFFLGVFYLNPKDPEGPPFGISPAELDLLFARFRLLARWRPGVAFPSRAGREEMRLYQKPPRR
jgi:methyl halide transferase